MSNTRWMGIPFLLPSYISMMAPFVQIHHRHPTKVVVPGYTPFPPSLPSLFPKIRANIQGVYEDMACKDGVPASLAVGEFFECSPELFILQSDIDVGFVTNTARYARSVKHQSAVIQEFGVVHVFRITQNDQYIQSKMYHKVQKLLSTTALVNAPIFGTIRHINLHFLGFISSFHSTAILNF